MKTSATANNAERRITILVESATGISLDFDTKMQVVVEIQRAIDAEIGIDKE
jgi:hypothetical protein